MVLLDAAAVEQRAHRGAAAEMGDDHPAARRSPGATVGEAAGDVLVGEAVEAVAADALVVEGARQGVAVGCAAVAAVEGGVEAGDLRQRRVDLRVTSADGARLCGWCSGASGSSAVSRARMSGVDAHRPVEVGAAVTTRWPTARSWTPSRPESQLRSAWVAAGRSGSVGGRPAAVDEGRAVGAGGAQARADADAVDLAPDVAGQTGLRRRRAAGT